MSSGFHTALPSGAVAIYVVVSGAPGAGKSTVAEALARELRLSYLSHDLIKERLADALGLGDDAWTTRLADAADDVFFALVPQMGGAVLDHWWRPPRYERFRALNMSVVEVFCRCPIDVLQARSDARAATQRRHPIHRDWRCPDVAAWWGGIAGALEPLGLGPVVEVRTDVPLDVSVLAAQVLALAPS